MGCLYKLTSPSGKSYVGITTFSIEKRLQEHMRYATKHGGRGPLRAAIRKYGLGAFDVCILGESEEWSELCQLERAAIVEHSTFHPHGYNMTSGGDGVPDLPPDAKARHRANTAQGTKAAWRDSSLRVNRSAVFMSEAFREKHSAATSVGTASAYQRPEVREALVKSRKDPDYRSRVSESVRKRWTDPSYRAKQTALRRARTKVRSAESIKAQSDRMRALIAERKLQGTYWNNQKDGHGTSTGI